MVIHAYEMHAHITMKARHYLHVHIKLQKRLPSFVTEHNNHKHIEEFTRIHEFNVKCYTWGDGEL
jgi:hypothetical protein